MAPQRTTGAEGVSIGWLIRVRMLTVPSPNRVPATHMRKICGQGFMRRFATVALTTAAELGALLLALWLDARSRPLIRNRTEKPREPQE